MKKKFVNIWIIFFLTSTPFLVRGQDVRISLFYGQLTEAFTFHCVSGEYRVRANGHELLTMKEGDILFLNREGGEIRLSDHSGTIGEYRSIDFQDVLLKGKFILKSVKPASGQRLYRGELFIKVEHNSLQIINQAEFSQYIAGVVEAEAGPGAPEEFFKVQAVICRTYAIKNWHRHASENFNLCDDTHCQVFHGIADDNPEILNAVLSTHNIVLADENYNLITAAFHSNSGGETEKADDIWPGEHEYLLAIIDPFSVDQPSYQWQEKLPLATWRSYLATRGINTDDLEDDQILIRQQHRKVYMPVGKDTIFIREVREDFGLRSSFFNMEKVDEEIILNGKGYGHGVGLSQEGGMEMAREGYSYEDILRFYYFNIQVKELNELPLSSFPAVFR